MIEFFESCWNWIMEHRADITTFFSSSTFVMVVTSIFALVKTIGSNNKNTLSISALKETISNNNHLADVVQEIKDSNDKSLAEVEKCEESLSKVEEKIKEFEDSTLRKVDAMMEVMSIVYSTIKDDTIRNSVSSVLISAKHAGETSKAKLESEIEELKKRLEEATANANAIVSDTVDKIKTVVVGTSDSTNISRY